MKGTAESWLADVLDQARRGVLSGMVQTGATFADAAAEWLRYVEQERGRKPSTIADYRCGAVGAGTRVAAAASGLSHQPTHTHACALHDHQSARASIAARFALR
jgi:hypothetical protein